MKNHHEVNKKLLEHYYEQKNLMSKIITFEDKIDQSIVEEIKSRGVFFDIVINGLKPCFLLKNYFENFENFLRFKKINVYEKEIDFVEIHKKNSRFYNMINNIINVENEIAALSQEKCQKVYLIRKKKLSFSSEDNPRLLRFYDCRLTEKVIFIGIPK